MVLPVTAADIDLIEHAAAIIDGEALALRVCSTIGPTTTTGPARMPPA